MLPSMNKNNSGREDDGGTSEAGESPDEESPTSESPASEGDGEGEAEGDGDGEEQEDNHAVNYLGYQAFVFSACYIGYSLYLYNRKVFSYTLPYVLLDGNFTSFHITLMLILQAFAYTVSKLVAGIMVDWYSPKVLFAVGMFGTGFFMVGFSDMDDVIILMVISVMNGIAQGFGWPCAAKMVRNWFSPTSFGFWFALLSTSTNLTSALGPSLANYWAVYHGWRTAIQMPAVIAIVCSAGVYFVTFDKPEDVNCDPYEKEDKGEVSHWYDMVSTEYMILLSVSYLLLFLIKSSIQDWGQLLLLEEKGMSTATASNFIVALEIGGAMGCVVTAAMSDAVLRNSTTKKSDSSPRMLFVDGLIALTAFLLNVFLFAIDSYSSAGFINFIAFALGFCIYGCICLIGVITIETSPVTLTGTAYGIISCYANVGALMAGVPLSMFAQAYSWLTTFLILNVLTLLVFFVLVIGKDLTATFVPPSKLKKKLK